MTVTNDTFLYRVFLIVALLGTLSKVQYVPTDSGCKNIFEMCRHSYIGIALGTGKQ